MILVRISVSNFWRITAGIQNDGRSFTWSPANFVRINAVITHRLLTLGRQVQEGGSNEVRSLENFEIAFGVVMALRAIDDGFASGVPCDFLQREWMSQQIFSESLATVVIISIDEIVTAVVSVESRMFPTE